MLDGHPELVRAIADEIGNTGPISFARFMGLALYHPTYGYYMRMDEGDGADRLGWSGDFYTSADVHPFLARALATQIQQVDTLLGHPDPFTVLEMGPGKGLLARDFLEALDDIPGSLRERLRYVLVEHSPSMRNRQQDNLAAWVRSGRLAWADDLAAFEPECLTGVCLSNELVDAFPVHRIRMIDGQPQECFVDVRDDHFVEVLRPLSTPALTAYLERLASQDITLSEGQTTEINLQAIAWMQDIGHLLARGLAITIDYGHTAADLYGPDRRTGTLLCYYHQMASEDPYQRVGRQDMTAHVDFSTLAWAGEAAGLAVTGFTNQMSLLISLGVEQQLDMLQPGSREFQALVHLLRPEGMGRTFKVLIQHKGIPTPELDGLRYKPFFGTALALSQARGTAHEARREDPISSASPLTHSPGA